jgi:Na+/H+-dicarboxylate symporter
MFAGPVHFRSFGFALTWLGDRTHRMIDLIDTFSHMLFGMVHIIVGAAPIGAFGAIGFTVGRFGLGSLRWAKVSGGTRPAINQERSP